jgi:hypothetical protein
MERKNFWAEIAMCAEDGARYSNILSQRPGIISKRKPLKYSVSGIVGRTG